MAPRLRRTGAVCALEDAPAVTLMLWITLSIICLWKICDSFPCFYVRGRGEHVRFCCATMERVPLLRRRTRAVPLLKLLRLLLKFLPLARSVPPPLAPAADRGRGRMVVGLHPPSSLAIYVIFAKIQRAGQGKA